MPAMHTICQGELQRADLAPKRVHVAVNGKDNSAGLPKSFGAQITLSCVPYAKNGLQDLLCILLGWVLL